MAATIAKCIGYDSKRVKEDQRLGSVAAQAHANTWRTFTTARVNADGSGFVTVMRDGKVIHDFKFKAEGKSIIERPPRAPKLCESI